MSSGLGEKVAAGRRASQGASRSAWMNTVLLVAAALLVHPARSQGTTVTKGAKCMESLYTYGSDANTTCRGKKFKLHRCVDSQEQADAFARNLKITGLSEEGCYEFYNYYCTQTIIGKSTYKPDAKCDYYCDRNFDPAVSDCDADSDCGGNQFPPFTPAPCCQGYHLVCENVNANALNAWKVNSACVWRRCMVFDASTRLGANVLVVLLAAAVSALIALYS